MSLKFGTMIREAKLFLLEHDWRPIADAVEKNEDYSLIHKLIIFQLMEEYHNNHHYAIVSISEKVDEIALAHRAIEADERDYLRTSLHDYAGEPLFGDKGVLVYLNKLQ